MVYEVKSLGGVGDEILADTHNQAFADYVVPMEITPEGLALYYRIVGVDKSQSFGAFCGGKLVGMIANAVDVVGGQTVAWDAMTGIAREHRGKGLFSRLFVRAEESLRGRGVSRYFLDVITSNEKAYRAYRGKGMEVVREFACLSGRSKGLGDKGVAVQPLSDWPDQDLCRYQPSFQNRMAGLRRAAAHYEVAAWDDVAVLVNGEGRISQIRYGGQGDADALALVCSHLSDRFESLFVSNIPTTETALIDALVDIGLGVQLNQYEMSKEL